MMNDDEHDLQRRFDAWSEQEQHAAPSFERVWRRAERVAVDSEVPSGVFRLWPRIAVVAAVVALGAAGLWWSVRDGSDMPAWEAQLAAFENELEALPAPPAAPEPEAWDLPTDFLLAGSEDNQNSNRIHR